MILQGNALTILKRLQAQSVNCVVTSPPYWGLRDYKTKGQMWGGMLGCNHNWEDTSYRNSRLTDSKAGPKQRSSNGAVGWRDGIRRNKTCSMCGAWYGSLGMEQYPELYVSHLVSIFREVRRVLRDDGTLWLNIGDSYSAGGGTQVLQTKNASHGLAGMRQATPGFLPKQLIMIPARLALALQADGWWLRSDIIWAKSNPMPESVKDRPTKAHEYVFLLAKSPNYYYNFAAVKEPCSTNSHGSPNINPGRKQFDCGNNPGGRLGQWRKEDIEKGRNCRSVWTIPTKPYKGAHFAVFPPKLVELCISAGCPAGGVVLDPFCGSGTTLLVAKEHGRSAIGIELNREYVRMAWSRLGLPTHSGLHLRALEYICRNRAGE